ncbi:12208_t:CDS:10 [Funneliformis geosporum]|uniref:17340_t:CDS:1 n=1 Tax=Funneliformis geosporum TaxID=1117311 RepID=A0A9W4SF33_9GLOM|nr:17340_t:CDS:10 [Funneliformis geosporum]CAI2190548.1 12208_t:CDS:10 [Funneliformis geosporum]
MALTGDYLQSTSPINWTLDDFADWIAINHSDDKKKIITYMKSGLNNYSKNVSNVNVKKKADDLLNRLKTLKDKKKIAELQSEQEVRLADIECSSVRQMQNHTNAAVTIHKQIAEKFVGMAQKISTETCAQIRTVTFSDEIPRPTEDENESEEEFESEEAEHEGPEHEESESEESDDVYLKTQNKKERKSGPFKLSDAGRTEIEIAYTKMKHSNMWKLSSGKFVEEELYNIGKQLEFEHSIHSFIIDTDDEIIKEHFSEHELEKIDDAPVPEVPDLPHNVIEYLNKFINVTSTKEARSLINEHDNRFNASYDPSIHHDLDYIRFALYALTREIENGGLTQPNLESWYNCYIWHAIVDQGFADIKGTSVVRGESTCIATATRKNRKRKNTQRRKMGRQGDWILRLTGNGDHDEYGMGEVEKHWEDEFGTKSLSETSLKQPKALKDMLVKLMKKTDWELRSKLQTVRITHSGLMMTIMYMNNPHGYVCRIRRGEILEVPDKEENLSAVLVILAAVLNIKIAVQETIKAVQQKGQNDEIFKQAGRKRRSRNSDEISACFTTPKKIKQ